jgi:hypothetical protein
MPDASLAMPTLLDHRRRGAITITTVAATWHAVTLRADWAGGTRWISVPGGHVDEFLAALDGGALDPWLQRLVARRPRRRAA